MRYISIQKKPPLGWELLMVFIISLYFNPFISIPYGAIKSINYLAINSIALLFQFLMVRLFLQRYKIYFNKTSIFDCYFYKLIDKNKLYVYKYC